MDDPTPGRALARYAVAARTAPLPPAVATKARLHTLDSLAAIVSGSALEAGRVGAAYATSLGGRGVASILGTAARVPLVEAALANGMAAHADESDDSHESSQTHPGCGVLPAALAAAEELSASGAQFLAAVALGYEVTIRIGEALAPALSFARSSLSCHAYGPLFGAGFAAGSLMRFDEEQFLVLLNYLAQEASGLTTWRLDDAHTLKSYVFAGMPASNGIKAAALVRAGFTGRGDVLSRRDRNFFAAMPPGTQPEALLAGLGEVHKILETDIKKYPVGFPIAAPVAALEQLLPALTGPIGAVRIRYLEDWYKVIGDENRMPDLNLRYCLAITALDGRLSFAASHDEARMHDPAVQALGGRISFLPAEEGQDRFEARVEVDAGGVTHRAAQGLGVRGRKENPMTAAEIEAKAEELLEMVLTPDAARRAVGLVGEIDALPGLVPLLAAVRP